MTQRTLTVSLAEAQEWYNSDDNALKEIALKLFSKTELQVINIKTLIKATLSANTFGKLKISSRDKQFLIDMLNLDEIESGRNWLRAYAIYCNAGWEKDYKEQGYFLTLDYLLGQDKYYWNVRHHSSVKYPGIVYFKREHDAEKALEALKLLNKLDDLYNL